MALKSKRPSTGSSLGGIPPLVSPTSDRHRGGGGLTSQTPSKPSVVKVETIEARLERKAVVADTKAGASESLGAMTRETRHKLLYGD